MRIIAMLLMLAASPLHLYAETYYVRPSGAGDGSSWGNASGSVQDMINVAYSAGGGDVWVAEGVYYPTQSLPGGSGAREVSFVLQRGVRLYGGFPAAGSPALSERDPLSYETILSGDIGEQDNSADNAIHVVYMDDAASSVEDTEINGFIIKHGATLTDFTDSMSPDIRGGGLLVRNASLRVQKCQFIDNKALLAGGLGFVVEEDYEKELAVIDCYFQNNESHYEAGGAGISAGSESEEEIVCSATASFIRCSFDENLSGGAGGGLGCGVGAMGTTLDLTITNCTFVGNVADDYGGGVIVHGRNSSSGAERPATLNAVVTNCTITENQGYLGSGISVSRWNYSDVNMLIANTIVWGNLNETAGPEYGYEISGSGGSDLSIHDCVVKDAASDGISGTHTQENTSNKDPKLDPAGLKNHGGFTPTIAILRCSSAINQGLTVGAHTMDVGGTNLQCEVPSQDQNGSDRLGAPDIGAFECISNCHCMNPVPMMMLLLD